MMYVLHCAPFDNAGIISAFCWGEERGKCVTSKYWGGGGSVWVEECLLMKKELWGKTCRPKGEQLAQPASRAFTACIITYHVTKLNQFDKVNSFMDLQHLEQFRIKTLRTLQPSGLNVKQ